MHRIAAIRPVRRRRPIHRPFQISLIAGFQFLKGGFLLLVAGLLWLAPDQLPNSEAFSQMLLIAAHGKSLSGVLVPAFGLWVCWIGFGLWRMRRRVRRNLAISSVLTIALSLQRLGLFGESSLTSEANRQSLYILILLDLAVYIYLAFHPAITRSFDQAS
jgi:hypothetical protein